MNNFKRIISSALLFSLLATPCLAEENAFKSFFEDVFYGSLSGGLVGAAVLAFTKQPGKHYDYIGYGAAGGALVGATYGTMVTVRSLAEVKNGEVKFAFPTIIPGIKDDLKGHSALVAQAQLLRGTF
jgi:hypothetical protein